MLLNISFLFHLDFLEELSILGTPDNPVSVDTESPSDRARQKYSGRKKDKMKQMKLDYYRTWPKGSPAQQRHNMIVAMYLVESCLPFNHAISKSFVR